MYIQLLACNSTLGNCCSDYGLANFLDIVRRIVELIQLIAPIFLLIMAVIQLVRLIMNPDLKNGLKGLYNKFQAAAIIFFVPVIVNAAMNILPTEFSISACWQSAKTIRELSKATPQRYTALSDQKATKIVSGPEGYESGVPSTGGSSSSGNTVLDQNVSGTGGEKIVNIALKELGNHESDHSHYKYNSYCGLADSDPWCAAFVSWCAMRGGYIDKGVFPRFVGVDTGYRLFQNLGAQIHLASSGYTPVAGDIIFFSWTGTSDLDHVGIVLSADSSNVYTIEGNTTCQGEAARLCANSHGVSKKTRPRDSTIYVYVTPNYGE